MGIPHKWRIVRVTDKTGTEKEVPTKRLARRYECITLEVGKPAYLIARGEGMMVSSLVEEVRWEDDQLCFHTENSIYHLQQEGGEQEDGEGIQG